MALFIMATSYCSSFRTVMGDEEYASGETDDTSREFVKIMKPGFGYATTLKILAKVKLVI